MLYRPQSVIAKTSKMNWIPGFKVITTNDMVCKVQCVATQKTDWVHRHQVRKVSKRPDHLVEPSVPISATRGRNDIVVAKPVEKIVPLPVISTQKSPEEPETTSVIEPTRKILTTSPRESTVQENENFERCSY